MPYNVLKCIVKYQKCKFGAGGKDVATAAAATAAAAVAAALRLLLLLLLRLLQ